jgi:hypothetical protein
MPEDAFRLTGGCQCGAVRYTLTARPTEPSVCHCRMCQRAGGAPYMALVGVRLAEIAWAGTPKIFASSTLAERGFCADCGTPLSYHIHGRDRISVTIASLDDPNAVPPVEQNGIESKLAWTDGVAGLPASRTEDWLTGDAARTFASHQHPTPGRDGRPHP